MVVIDYKSIIIIKCDINKLYSCYYWCVVVVVADISAEILIKYVVFGVVDVYNFIFKCIASLKLIISDVYWLQIGFEQNSFKNRLQ